MIVENINQENFKIAFNCASRRWTSLLKMFKLVATLSATVYMLARHE